MDFALILFVLFLISGVLWLVDRFFARKRRQPGTPVPFWVEYGAGFFPVILIVFVVRSFVVEPFKIPSGSMIPTLLVGDFILVNKWTYGIRLPVIDKKIIDINLPERGEVMVFRYPVNPSENYIKRVIGVPGDRVEYIDKRLYINGEAIKTVEDGSYLTDRMYYAARFKEQIGDIEHQILIERDKPPLIPSRVFDYPYRDNCVYSREGITCTVPEKHYFVMGDNRDDSMDSRVWGFVPEDNIVGKAFFVWFNFSDLKRIGRFH